jgi:hypothetical protein
MTTSRMLELLSQYKVQGMEPMELRSAISRQSGRGEVTRRFERARLAAAVGRTHRVPDAECAGCGRQASTAAAPSPSRERHNLVPQLV